MNVLPTYLRTLELERLRRKHTAHDRAALAWLAAVVFIALAWVVL